MAFPSDCSSNPVHTYGNNFDLPIPANPGDTKGWMADAVIEINDHFIIEDIDICINVTHTSAFDLQIFLQSPAGTGICLSMFDPYDEFFFGANYTNTIFDDESPFYINQGTAPFTGRFRPVDIDPYNKLSKFDGEDAYGPWRLRIYDAYYADTGTLNRLDLMITAPEPASATLMIFGVVSLGLFKPRRSQ
jgi:subtilisin-like proprotein convertase family protein